CKTPTDAARNTMRLYDLERHEVVTDREALQRLQAARIVLVGEHHNNAAHHKAQLKVIRSLHEAGRKVAVGLEMFRRDSQQDLDQWIAGTTSESQFEPIYLDNWSFSWELYGPIFKYAKKNRIPMVGLNVPRSITGQVASKGFESLSKAQKGALEGITCDVTQQYRNFIGKAYGAHAHGHMNFNRFCEAQLVWDSAMAVYAIDYLEQRSDTTMVLLAGSGHARKLGIPYQIAKRTPWDHVVVMPETKGVFDPEVLTAGDADYILLNE
ncbi:MAG: ChaN family lipoprotein, partial [Desulfobacteraceae bacterium]